ncbi:MAG TPA: TAT-variant-translocated molybdopterin oxidoreductase [Pirellulales bacterium]|jgi:molybdopterin-containing oxidoreductase family iron-sulfur binding subunit|nr:TAT-variant-translocated molybdopterin oxidoreductase [Pirellulales bacterium]
MDYAALREKLAATSGKRFWRCLEELADDPDLETLLRRQFAGQAMAWADPLDRRKFLSLLGASLALAGISGCSVQPPVETIMPYVRSPSKLTPGIPLFFATAATVGESTIGLLVESHEGRPTKIEGNPDHPASRGATDVFAQAVILEMYDPDRSQTVLSAGEISTRGDAVVAIRAAVEKQRGKQGAGLRFLTPTVTSPTLADQLAAMLKVFPAARWHQYEPAARDSRREGSRLAFGELVNTIYHFDRADVILSLDADFLAPPGNLHYVRDFADRRRVTSSANDAKRAAMNRLYVAECTPSITGAKADHRWAMRAAEVERFARAIAAKIDPRLTSLAEGASHPVADASVGALVRDLQKTGAKSVVVAGDRQPPAVHAMAHAMNGALGANGTTVTYTDPSEFEPTNQMKSLAELTSDMAAGSVELLVILDVNAVYSAPADLEFAKHLARIPLSVHLGLYRDETAALCHWHIPKAHFLESWSDARCCDGTATIIQPLIAPLYDGRTPHEVLQLFAQPAETTGYEIVRDYWRRYWKDANRSEDFETFWETAVHDGFIPDTSLSDKKVAIQQDSIRTIGAVNAATTRSGADSERPLEIVFATDPTIFDGRFANNGWLQELPKPLTKLTWDNAALISPALAERLGLSAAVSGHGGEHGEVTVDAVELSYAGHKLRAPVWIMPGQPDGSVTVHLGYGRTAAGRVGSGIGFNANLLRTSAAPWFDGGLEIRRTGEQMALACTQYHHRMEDRNLVRTATLDEFRRDPTFAKETAKSEVSGHGQRTLPTLYAPQEHPYNGYKWGMAIDLNACIGCNACVVACQAENNIPVVGKEQVTRGREMHWIRIDRYYRGRPDDPEYFFQPVNCMQCENAPCELVCPVEATVHSDEGLNDMVYNRCVGTRYCSNNCPYKVRRFNFLQYSDFTTPSLQLLRNPEVTVRSRGVMEKCTYCVQRITQGRIAAEKEDRPVRDGEVLTACQAVCPAHAISFGDLNDQKSEIAEWKARPLEYPLLGELNTVPRTTYLAELRNPNLEIESA